MSEQADGMRELVRERYAVAATMAAAGAPPSCCDSTGQAVEVGEGFGADLYAQAERGELSAEAVVPAWVAATPSRSPNCGTGRPSSTWVPAVGLTCCSLPAGSAPPGRSTAWI
ncbi:MAG TPA: hypothetical protein VE196_11510 [Pseudonocardiaceae bacterium]|nr:hypothetical protein [Pseudonocardiaceae bacterium]